MNEVFLVPAMLNVDCLSSAEVARVRVFLPYCRGRTRHHWHLAPVGDLGHALFVDVDDPATISGAHRVPGGIVRIQRRGTARAPSGDSMTLSAPLQLEEFIQMLQRVEARMARSMATASAAAPSRPMPALVSQQQPGGGGSVLRSMRAPGSLSLTAAYRLKRWPPAGVLGTHRYNARLASFLSARHLTPLQLSTFSNVDSSWCVEFLSALQDIGLLDKREAAAKPHGSSSSSASRAAAAVPAVRSADLLGRIRRRLGIE